MLARNVSCVWTADREGQYDVATPSSWCCMLAMCCLSRDTFGRSFRNPPPDRLYWLTNQALPHTLGQTNLDLACCFMLSQSLGLAGTSLGRLGTREAILVLYSMIKQKPCRACQRHSPSHVHIKLAWTVACTHHAPAVDCAAPIAKCGTRSQWGRLAHIMSCCMSLPTNLL